jgi:hypothetical protein
MGSCSPAASTTEARAEQAGHVRGADRKRRRVEGDAPALITGHECGIRHGIWCHQSAQPREPEMPLGRLTPGRVHRVRPRRQRPRTGQLLLRPRDFNAQSADRGDPHTERWR